MAEADGNEFANVGAVDPRTHWNDRWVSYRSIWVRNGNHTRQFRGTAPALEALGLIQADWVPGLPGRNKTRQAIIFTDGGPEFVRAQGSPLSSRAGDKDWLVISRASARTFVVERPYRESEHGLQQKANEEATWKPKSKSAYGIELELCGRPRASLTFSEERSRNNAKFELERASTQKIRADIEAESVDSFDQAHYMFALVRYFEIISELKGGDDDGRGGGRKAPEPSPTPLQPVAS